MKETSPSVSVVIATYNREQSLFDTCNSLFNQDYRSFDIIIIDQSEEISTAKKEYYNLHPQIKVYYLDRPNRCRAKSFGVQQSTAEIVLICDDDIICPADLISKHSSHYSDPLVGGVTCRVYEEGLGETDTKNVLRINFYGRLYRNAHSTTSGYVQFPDGPNMSFRRKLFDKVGYFDEAFIGTGIMEEPDLAYRVMQLGYKIYFDASTTVLHFPQSNGNLKIKGQDQSLWYRNFFHNYSLFHKKHRLFGRLIIAFPFNLLLGIKVIIKHKLSLDQLVFMMRGYFNK